MEKLEDDIERLARALIDALFLIAVSGPRIERMAAYWPTHAWVTKFRAWDALNKCSQKEKLGISQESADHWTIRPNEAEDARWKLIEEIVKSEGWVKACSLLEKEWPEPGA